MPQAPQIRQPPRSPAVSTEVLTDKQCQRILALRAAREVLEVKSPSNPFAAGGTDVKSDLLLVVAQWIMTGNLRAILHTLSEVNTSTQAPIAQVAEIRRDT